MNVIYRIFVREVIFCEINKYCIAYRGKIQKLEFQSAQSTPSSGLHDLTPESHSRSSLSSLGALYTVLKGNLFLVMNLDAQNSRHNLDK